MKVFTQTFGVVAAILEKEGKILLIKENQPDNPEAHNRWSHPAGWLEVGENPIEAVRREVKEETGFTFDPKGVLGVYSFVKYPHGEAKHTKHCIKIVFIGTLLDVPVSPLAEDSSEVRWFSSEEIMRMDSSELRDMDIKQMVKDYLQGKRYPLEVISHFAQE